MTEAFFLGAYGSPLLQAMVGLGAPGVVGVHKGELHDAGGVDDIGGRQWDCGLRSAVEGRDITGLPAHRRVRLALKRSALA